MPSPSYLGIDFGTSHTVAVLRRGDGSTTPLLFDGSPLLPSAVFAEADGSLLTGSDAIHSARMDPARFEPNPKLRVDDGSLLLGDREIPVVELFATVLKRVVLEAERVAGVMPSHVTVTHPAAWGPTRRQVLEDAVAEAGLGQASYVSEPVAAARYFATVLGEAVPEGSAVVVYDFGGGTFDASVVARSGDGFEVLAVDGSPDLGGVDVDQLLVEHIGRQFAGDPKWDGLANPASTGARRQRRHFVEDVRLAKERLSRQQRVDLPVPMVDVDTHLTRAELDELTRPLLDKAVRITTAVIRAAKLPTQRLAGVFLVGGASRMPLVATTLHAALGSAPTVIEQPQLVVAQGAVCAEPRADEPVTPSPAPITSPVTPPSFGPPPVSAVPPPSMAPPPPPRPVVTPRRPYPAMVSMGLASVLSLATIVTYLVGFANRKTTDEYNDFSGPNGYWSIERRLAVLDYLQLGMQLVVAVAGVLVAVAIARLIVDTTARAWRFARLASLVMAVAIAALPTVGYSVDQNPFIGSLFDLGVLGLITAACLLLHTDSARAWYHRDIDPSAFAEPGSRRSAKARALISVFAAVSIGSGAFTMVYLVLNLLLGKQFPLSVMTNTNTDEVEYNYDDGRPPSHLVIQLLLLGFAVTLAVFAVLSRRPKPAQRRVLLGLLYSAPVLAVAVSTAIGDDHLIALLGFFPASLLDTLVSLLVTGFGVAMLHSRAVRAWFAGPRLVA